MPNFIHLHCHTEYSLEDSLIDVKSLSKKVRDLGMPACAVTDQNNLFALVKFYRAAQAEGIKPIVGTDMQLYDSEEANSRLVLLCQNTVGYRNLTRLLSKSYTEGQVKGIPYLRRHWLNGHTEGLIALSGGRAGDIGQALLAGHSHLVKQYWEDWQALFPQRFYLELQRTGRPREEEYIYAAVELALATATPVVATNDVCFLTSEDFEAHEVRVCIHQGNTLADPQRPRHHSTQQYLRSPQEMVELFSDLPEAIENTWYIAQRCNLELTLGKNFLPDYPIPTGQSTEEYFRQQAHLGLEERLATLFDRTRPEFAQQRRPYDERLARELDVIVKMGFPGYFLIVSDFIQWAKDNHIPVGPGRGSGAGSLVAYALRITDLDPLKYDLLFERFLNPERVSMPDFDIDFCQEGRDRVIEYVAKRYGRERVSQIITYGSMAAKAVVRDVGRVLGHPHGFVDKIAKLIPFEVGITLADALEREDELRSRYRREEEVRILLDMAQKLEGLVRNPGKHAGGVVIAPTLLTDFTPLYCEEGSSDLITQFDKDDVEAIGLVKFDFLGLRTLTIIDWALENIHRALGQRIDISKIPLDDATTFDLLKKGQTTAVFQLESSGIKKLIRDLRPDRFEDLVALVALYRPGPLQSGMVKDFIDRKHGRARVEYPHPDLAPILKPTYGVIVYQEQVMQIAQVLAGYTLGGADLLRRCLSGSTQVIDTQTGNLVSLQEMASRPQHWRGRYVFALHLKTQKMTRQPIAEIYSNGVRNVWEIATKTHRKIKATEDHLFYTLLGWKPLKNFKVGDRIGLAKTLPITHSSNISDAQIKLTAYLIGDGYLCPGKPSHSYFCNSDPALIADFNRCAEELFGSPAPIDYQQRPGYKPVGYARVGFISAFNHWVDQHIKRACSKDKLIPQWVFSLSETQLQLFLGILWSTDGSFDIRIGHTDYTSTSEELVKQIQHLLLRLGIVALFNVKNSHYQGRPYFSYRVQITGREDMLKFCESIQPFLSQSKQEKAQLCYLMVKDKPCTYSKHTIPPEIITLLATAKKMAGMTWKEMDNAVGFKRGRMSGGLSFTQPPKRSLSRPRVHHFAKALQNTELQHIADSEVFWDEIVSIEYVGKEEVFDLSIPEDHNFIANDFIVHNCMGKKKPDEMAQQRTVFLGGSKSKGIKEETATYIFDLMEKFAEYGFNKSHSAAYALVSYQTAWLKTHYPAAFMAAVLSSDMDKTEKIVHFLGECDMMNLKMLPPDINLCEYKFTVAENQTGAIRYGLGALKGVGEAALENIFIERQKHGSFTDLFDFCRRIDLRKANRRVLESLIKAGAIDALGPHRATLMASIDSAIKLAEKHTTEKATGQNDIFASSTSTKRSKEEKKPFTVVPDWPLKDKLQGEKDVLGVYLSGHPIQPYLPELKQLSVVPLTRLKATDSDQNMRVGGWVEEVRFTYAYNKRMAFLTLEDEKGRLEVKVSPELYEQKQNILIKNTLLIVTGKVREDNYNEGYTMTADQIYDLDQARGTQARRIEMTVSATQAQAPGLVQKLLDILTPYRQEGRCRVVICYFHPEAEVELLLGEKWHVQPQQTLLQQLQELLGGEEKVKVVY